MCEGLAMEVVEGQEGKGSPESAVSDEEVPWDRSQGSPEGGRASGWECIGSCSPQEPGQRRAPG